MSDTGERDDTCQVLALAHGWKGRTRLWAFALAGSLGLFYHVDSVFCKVELKSPSCPVSEVLSRVPWLCLCFLALLGICRL